MADNNLWLGRKNLRSGIPFRGEPRLFKHDEPVEDRPKIIVYPKVKVFYLDDPEALKEYEDVLFLCANGPAEYIYQRERYNEDRQRWEILLCWKQHEQMEPSMAKNEILSRLGA